MRDKLLSMKSTPHSPAHLRVWDLPTRVFHITFALVVIGAIACAKLGSSDLMVWHTRLGIVAVALWVFRVIWGLVGPRTARFSQFIVSPMRAWQYLRGAGGAHAAPVGHNPAGGWAVIAMLLIIGFQGVTGLFVYDDISIEGPLARYVSESMSSTLTGLHKINEKPLFAILLLHIVAIAVYSAKGRSIVRPMISGDVPRAGVPAGTPATRDDAATRLLALVIAALAATGAWWLLGLMQG